MKLILNVAVLLGLTVAVLAGVTASSSATAPAAHSVVALPTSGCTVLSHAPDVVEQCGQCTILGTSSQDELYSLIHQIAKVAPDPVWFTVGNHWIGSNDNTDLGGAVGCADKYGGTVERFVS